MADTTLPGAGTVSITLAGESGPIDLKCSLGATIALCAQPGGIESDNPNISTVTTRLMGLDLPTMALIIRLGLGIGASAVKGLEQQIYETGLYDVRAQIAPFVGMLKNGGRPLQTVEQGGEAGGEGDPPNG